MKKILIADDEPDIVKILQFRLKGQGYEVIIAVNGQEALDMAGKVNPDLILLDVSMPFLKGDEVCQKIKADEALKHIPVLLMTASTRIANEESVLQLGAQGFILKPFETEEFLETVGKFLK